jgi:hypothetical protein
VPLVSSELSAMAARDVAADEVFDALLEAAELLLELLTGKATDAALAQTEQPVPLQALTR